LKECRVKIPEFYEEPNHEHNLISEICRRVKGVGESTGQHIASYLDTAEQFMECTADDLLSISNKKGKAILKPGQAERIIELRGHYLPAGVYDVRQLWVTYLVRDFVERAIKEIQETDFDKLLINPFLIRAFNFTDHKEVIAFCFYQKVTRSIVTSWGFTVERMLLVSGGMAVKKGFDLLLRRGDTDYYLQIKAVPTRWTSTKFRT
jgi:hypothetical protein